MNMTRDNSIKDFVDREVHYPDEGNTKESNLSSTYLKRNHGIQSEEDTQGKKMRLSAQDMTTGVLLVHASFRGHMFSRMFETQSTSSWEVIQQLDERFNIFKNGLASHAENMDRLCSESLSRNSEKEHSSNLVETIEDPNNARIQTAENHCSKTEDCEQTVHIETNLPNKETEFKVPLADTVNSVQARLSSSTSSSSDVRQSIDSMSQNRSSTTSLSTQSEVSIVLSQPLFLSDSSNNSFDKIEPNVIETSDTEDIVVKVYARWKAEKYFYSGHFKGSPFANDLQVYFDDNSFEMVKNDDILMQERLPIDTKVLVDLENSGTFEQNFIIKDHVDIRKFKSQTKKGYVVSCQTSKKEYRVSRDCVSVHKDEVMRIKHNSQFNDSKSGGPPSPSSSKVSVENIIAGKRNIKWKRFSQFVSPGITPTRRCASPSVLNMFMSPKKERSIPQRTKNLLINRNSSFSSHSTNSGKLFSDWYFMVTREDNQDGPGTLTKDYVNELIEENGGRIIETPLQGIVEEQRRKECTIVLIVLGKSHLTIKFMMALAVGNVPIVGIDWLIQCVHSSSIIEFDKFLLPRGFDEENKEISQVISGQDRILIFENSRIWIVVDIFTDFGKEWRKVLELAGAQVTLVNMWDFHDEMSVRDCDFVVLDTDGVSKNCVRFLKTRGIKAVDIGFVIDSLVNNRVLEMDKYVQ